MTQTVIQTLIAWGDEMLLKHPQKVLSFAEVIDKAEELLQMEKEQLIKAYNAGYEDAQCNHINDAENYVDEIRYLQSKIEMIDDMIKSKEEKIANILINGVNNKL